MFKIYKKIISCFILTVFAVTQIFPLSQSNVYAQTVLGLSIPGQMIGLTPAYNPSMIRGITIYPDNPLQFDFMIDSGDDNLKNDQFKAESTKLIKYFLASLTVPEDQMWVNLSPYEKDRIVPDAFGQTEMGRDLLAQDYMLKQLTASLMYPEEELGAKFWEDVYAQAQEKYGTTQIPTNSFNKVWIVPEKALIYVNGTNVFVAESKLKVMLEEDYLALDENQNNTNHGLGNVTKNDLTQITDVSINVIRDVIIPVLQKEVNEGKTFAKLRQIYNASILAAWYKQKLKNVVETRHASSLLGYIDQNKIAGIEIEDKDAKTKIYNQYVEAFKKGVYDFVKEDYDPVNQEIVTRKYFSGGVALEKKDLAMTTDTSIVKKLQTDLSSKSVQVVSWRGADSNRAVGRYISVEGGIPLKGKVKIGGSKHSISVLMGAALLADGKIVFDQFPTSQDGQQMVNLYKSFGANIDVNGEQLSLDIDAGKLHYSDEEINRVGSLRSSILLLGSALLRLGEISFPMPGGDQIGRDFVKHFEILDSFGIEHNSMENNIMKAKIINKLSGDRTLDLIIHEEGKPDSSGSFTTSLAMILAAGNEGTTVLKNALVSSEITELGTYLSQIGIEITGSGTDTLVMKSPGISNLQKVNISHKIDPDKTEIVFWIIASLMTKGNIDIEIDSQEAVTPDNLGPLSDFYLEILKPIGIEIEFLNEKTIRIDSAKSKLKASDLEILYNVGKYSNFSDSMVQFLPLLAITPGVSHISDKRFGNIRFRAMYDLKNMGAKITEQGTGLTIEGVNELTPTSITKGSDIRDSANLLLAALSAKGNTNVFGLDHLDRSYGNIYQKLKELGASYQILTKNSSLTESELDRTGSAMMTDNGSNFWRPYDFLNKSIAYTELFAMEILLDDAFKVKNFDIKKDYDGNIMILGFGRNTEHLLEVAKTFPRSKITAIEGNISSIVSVQSSIDKVPSEIKSRIDIQKGDIRDLKTLVKYNKNEKALEKSQADGSIDLIIVPAVLDLYEDDDASLRSMISEFKRVLKPGGIVVAGPAVTKEAESIAAEMGLKNLRNDDENIYSMVFQKNESKSDQAMTTSSNEKFLRSMISENGEILKRYGISEGYILPETHPLHDLIVRIQNKLDQQMPDLFTPVKNIHLTTASLDTDHSEELSEDQITKTIDQAAETNKLPNPIKMQVDSFGSHPALDFPLISLRFNDEKDREFMQNRREFLLNNVAKTQTPASHAYHLTISWPRRLLTDEEKSKMTSILNGFKDEANKISLVIDKLDTVYHDDNFWDKYVSRLIITDTGLTINDAAMVVNTKQPKLSFASIDQWIDAIKQLKDEADIVNWKNVFEAELESLDGLESIGLTLERKYQESLKYSINVPIERNQEIQSLVSKYIAAFVVNRAVKFGANQVIVSSEDDALINKISDYLENDFGHGIKHKSLANMMGAYYEFLDNMPFTNFNGSNFLNNLTADIGSANVLSINIGQTNTVLTIIKTGNNGAFEMATPVRIIKTWGENTDKADLGALFDRIKIASKQLMSKQNINIDGIGISIAARAEQDVPLTVPLGVIKNFSKEDLEIWGNMQNEISSIDPNVPIVVLNDASAQATFSASLYQTGELLTIRFGTTLCAGYVDEFGNIPEGFGELSRTIIDMQDQTSTDDYYKHRAGNYISFRGIVHIAKMMGLIDKYKIDDENNVPFILKEMINNGTDVEKSDASKVYEQIGIRIVTYLNDLNSDLKVKNLILQEGTATDGKPMDIIIESAKKQLTADPELANINLIRMSADNTKVGSLVGTGLSVRNKIVNDLALQKDRSTNKYPQPLIKTKSLEKIWQDLKIYSQKQSTIKFILENTLNIKYSNILNDVPENGYYEYEIPATGQNTKEISGLFNSSINDLGQNILADIPGEKTHKLGKLKILFFDRLPLLILYENDRLTSALNVSDEYIQEVNEFYQNYFYYSIMRILNNYNMDNKSSLVDSFNQFEWLDKQTLDYYGLEKYVVFPHKYSLIKDKTDNSLTFKNMEKQLKKLSLSGKKVLIFKDDSGFQSIVAARLGASVDSLSFNETSSANINANISYNNITEAQHKTIEGQNLSNIGTYDLIVADLPLPRFRKELGLPDSVKYIPDYRVMDWEGEIHKLFFKQLAKHLKINGQVLLQSRDIPFVRESIENEGLEFEIVSSHEDAVIFKIKKANIFNESLTQESNKGSIDLKPNLNTIETESDVAMITDVSIHFSWQTFGSLLKRNTIFPNNPKLVADFSLNPKKYPELNKIFKEANLVFNDVDFFKFLDTNLSEQDPSLVRIAHIIFSYGLAKQWLSNGNFNLKGLNFTSGGIFPALFLSDSLTLKEGLPFIRQLYDYLFAEGKKIQDIKKTKSSVLKGSASEDILNLIRSILLINSELNNKVFIKEIRWFNEIIISGEDQAVEILNDLYRNGQSSKYVQSGQYLVPIGPLGDFIEADKRHQVINSYPDLPLHTPLLLSPSWWNERISGLNLKEPSFPIIGQHHERMSVDRKELTLAESIKEAIFGVINSVGTFSALQNNSEVVASIGTPQWFVDSINPEIKNNPILLDDPFLLSEKKVGGIDLNPNLNTIETKGDAVDFNFSFDPYEFEDVNFDGLTPVIINITPATNLNMLLGIKEEKEETLQLSSIMK